MKSGVWMGVLLMTLVGCSERLPPTPRGLLLGLSAHALGTEGPIARMEARDLERARCVERVPDGTDVLFALEVGGRAVETDAGPRFVDVQVHVTESRCDVDASLAAPPDYDEVGGIPRGEAVIAVSYRCADFHGAGAILVPSDGPPVSRMSGLTCTPD